MLGKELKGSVKEPNKFHNMKLRKSLIKPVTWLFGSSIRDRHAQRI